MYKHLTFFIKLTYLLLLFFFITCCSKKNQSINKNNEVVAPNNANLDYINPNALIEPSPNSISFANMQYEDNLNEWFVSKHIKVLNKYFHYSASLPENFNISPIDKVFLINTVPNYSTSFEYYKRFFNKCKVIGYSIFIYNKSFKFKYLERVAKAKGANIVILKKVHNKEKENYIYDILYLKGKLYSSYCYWMRNSSEAIPVNTTLESIKYSKKSLDNSYLASSLRIKSLDSVKQIPSVQYKVNPLLQPLNENIDSFFQLMQEPQNDDQELNTNPIDTLDEGYKALETRVSNVVGLWMDSYDKTIVRIQEISSEVIKKYDVQSFYNSNMKYYGAYIELPDEESKYNYNSYRYINIDNKLLWNNNDLKFQFDSNGNGVFLNYSKMPIPALIKVFPAKGVLIVNLPNGELRYFIPVDFTNIKPEILKKLYSNQPTFVEGKETSIGNNISYTGYGLYGWVVFSGLMLLGLGIISFI